jgi:23S rRNA pseudouridine2605 synthase
LSEERLQKILARAGVTSRRKAEELVREGRVTVNGRVAGIGDKADLESDAVKLDGKRIEPPPVKRYLVLNKPRGVMSTLDDPGGRPTVIELVPPGMRKALVPVGRLDFDTEGLLILTDDGDFAQRIAHPRNGCTKTYEVKVKGRPESREIERLQEGVMLEGRRTAPCRIRPRFGDPGRREEEDGNTWWTVELGEGRTRQIREMFFRIGHRVQKLRRVGIGPLFDAYLPIGGVRELTEREVEALNRAAGGAKPAGVGKRSARPRSGGVAAEAAVAAPPPAAGARPAKRRAPAARPAAQTLAEVSRRQRLESLRGAPVPVHAPPSRRPPRPAAGEARNRPSARPDADSAPAPRAASGQSAGPGRSGSVRASSPAPRSTRSGDPRPPSRTARATPTARKEGGSRASRPSGAEGYRSPAGVLDEPTAARGSRPPSRAAGSRPGGGAPRASVRPRPARDARDARDGEEGARPERRPAGPRRSADPQGSSPSFRPSRPGPGARTGGARPPRASSSEGGESRRPPSRAAKPGAGSGSASRPGGRPGSHPSPAPRGGGKPPAGRRPPRGKG